MTTQERATWFLAAYAKCIESGKRFPWRYVRRMCLVAKQRGLI